MRLRESLSPPDGPSVSERPPRSERFNPAARILRQLLEALLFEGILPLEHRLSADRWQPLEFDAGQTQYCCRARIGAFGRVRLEPGSLRILAPGIAEAEQPWRALLAAVAPAAHMDQLCLELQQTLMLCHWNQRFLGTPPPRRSLAYPALESALDEGHPYHPCFKARSGFNLSDHRSFGPECRQAFSLVWIAIERKKLCQVLPEPEPTFWQRELGREHWFRLRAGFNRLGLDWADYAVLPVHPWQWQKLNDGELGAMDERQAMHYLGCFGDRFCASQTVRTLLNSSNPGAGVIKLPLAIVNTSSRRTLAPHSVATAPALSGWLKHTVGADPFFARGARLVVLGEYAGMLYRPMTEQSPLAGHLGAIWRENVEHFLLPGERAVPFNALMAAESDGHPFIDEWVRRHGLQRWTEQLIRCAVLPVWHLLAAHGIALEAHAQNMVLVHHNGWPTAVALRDFHESIEYVDDFLALPDDCPDFGSIDPSYRDAPDDRYFRMASVEALRELVMDSLFVFNLAELSHLLESAYGLAESLFWQTVSELLEAYARGGHTTAERHARLGYDREMIRSEALLSRKLHPDPEREQHHLITNALAQAQRSATTEPSTLTRPRTGSSEHALRQ